jgi:large subunit ribosomal protein L29
MKASELRSLTDEQLEERLKELHTEWRDLRFQEAVGQLTATSRIRQIRKDIARIHTIRTEQSAKAAAQ